jgi:hypothetical protein
LRASSRVRSCDWRFAFGFGCSDRDLRDWLDGFDALDDLDFDEDGDGDDFDDLDGFACFACFGMRCSFRSEKKQAPCPATASSGTATRRSSA